MYFEKFTRTLLEEYPQYRLQIANFSMGMTPLIRQLNDKGYDVGFYHWVSRKGGIGIHLQYMNYRAAGNEFSEEDDFIIFPAEIMEKIDLLIENLKIETEK